MVWLLLIASSPCAAVNPQSEPYRPTDDAQILEHLPSSTDPRVRAFATLKQQVASRSGDVKAAVALAEAYLDYGRDTGDARYLGRAEAIIAPWTTKDQPPDAALVVEATILQSRHQFAQARKILTGVVQRDHGNMQAWLTLSSVALIQGDMESARKACVQLLRSGDALATAGCTAAWATANGKAKQSLESIETILQSEGRDSPVVLAWAHGLMADAAKYLGKTARADAEFRQALQFAPGDNFLLADYADFLLDQGRAKEALALTRGYAQSDTSFLRQVLAEAALNLPAAESDSKVMASRFHDLAQRGDSHLYAREEARFVLHLQHNPVRALELARDNWNNQRAPEDARIYLEAALAANQPEAARSVLEFLDRTGLEDPKTLTLGRQVSARIATPVAP